MCVRYEELRVGDAIHRDDLKRVHLDVKGIVEHVLRNLRQCGAATDRSLLVACANVLPPPWKGTHIGVPLREEGAKAEETLLICELRLVSNTPHDPI